METTDQKADELKQMRDEFNSQRAKMKDLFVQKEAECKQREEEISSLRFEIKSLKEEQETMQLLLSERMDEADRLRQENNELKETIASQKESPSLAPVISHVKNQLVRRLGAASSSDSMSQENLDDSMRKVKKYAQEDAEVLRSLITPLEEEIQQLKDKLRESCEELEKYRSDDKKPPESALLGMIVDAKSAAGSKTPDLQCDMCVNYETKLVQSQTAYMEESKKAADLVKTVEELRTEIEKEITLRRQLDEQWLDKKEQQRKVVEQLTEQAENNQKLFQNLVKSYNELKESTNLELLKLSEERERVYEHLETLTKDNEFLSGRYLQHSQLLRDEAIDLPQNVSDLHELVLRLHEDLIVCKTASEFAESKQQTYQDEATILREQMSARDRERQYIEREMRSRIEQLQDRIRAQEECQATLASERDELERRGLDYEKQNSELRMQAIELSEAKEKFEKTSQDLRFKVTALQQELANNEAVQKDFVKLSQSLQMQLEKIRSEHTQVRWQDEDDVNFCAGCKREFTVTRRKRHCRHCGSIFCDLCLTKTVQSGKRAARVCDVCHTLLVSTSAPYFSQEPPQSP